MQVYRSDQAPPFGLLASNTAQHVGVILAINIAFPLIVLEALGPAAVDEQNYIGLALVALGVGSILQAQRTRFFGSGLMVPTTFTAAYVPGTLLAAERGGIALISGMLLFAAAVELLVGLSIRRLRQFISVEIAGLVVLIIGILLGMVGFRLMLNLDAGGRPTLEPGRSPWLGAGVLAIMVIASVYAPGRLKTLAALIGLVAGIALSFALGMIETGALWSLGSLSPIALPIPETTLPRFDPTLVPVFALAGLACALRAAGDVTTAQKTSAPNWRRPEYGQISRGIVADGITTAFSALIGSLGTNTFSGSVGLAAAAGVMSRAVCVAVGVALVVMGLLPPVRAFALLIPPEVLGAVLLFSAAYIILSGMVVITSRALNNQRIMVVGISLVAALASHWYFGFFEALPPVVHTVTQSDLTIAISVALLLKLVLGVDRSKSAEASFAAHEARGALEFLRGAAADLGIARDAATRAEATLEEVFESLPRAAADAAVEVRLATFAEAVTLSVALPEGLEQRIAEPGLQVITEDLLDDADIDALMRGVRQRLIAGRADHFSTKRRAGREVMTFVFDQ